MPRYGKQPIPKTKAAFLAALKRAEARGWQQAAESLRAPGPSVTVEEYRQRMLDTARNRTTTAEFIEEIERTKPADRDSLLSDFYKALVGS